MSRLKRFRDMSLTEDDLWSRICEYEGKHYDPDGYGYYAQRERLEARAQRLLPLWRQWGLRDLTERAEAAERGHRLAEQLRELGRSHAGSSSLTEWVYRRKALEQAAQLAEAYEAEVEKRIAELESHHRQRIRDLQSQLAWTPVSEGLPTEPGLYAFHDGAGLEPFWPMHNGSWKDRAEEYIDPAYLRNEHVRFRRIELPEAK